MQNSMLPPALWQRIRLLHLCDNWNNSRDVTSRAEAFSTIVRAGVDVFGRSQRELADEFEVSESTVSRWANGVTRPHPRLQQMVVTAIRRRSQRAQVKK